MSGDLLVDQIERELERLSHSILGGRTPSPDIWSANLTDGSPRIESNPWQDKTFQVNTLVVAYGRLTPHEQREKELSDRKSALLSMQISLEKRETEMFRMQEAALRELESERTRLSQKEAELAAIERRVLKKGLGKYERR